LATQPALSAVHSSAQHKARKVAPKRARGNGWADDT